MDALVLLGCFDIYDIWGSCGQGGGGGGIPILRFFSIMDLRAFTMGFNNWLKWHFWIL